MMSKENHSFRNTFRILTAIFSICLFTAASSGVAQASEPLEAEPPGTLELVIQAEDGSWVPVEIPEPLDLEAPSAPAAEDVGEGTVTPYLVNPTQWTACFVFNLDATVFATYAWVTPPTTTYVELQCGNSSYGYKHIIAQGHDTHWQTVFNAAVAAGWSNGTYGAYSWDDLMNIVLAMQLSMLGGYYAENPISNKACNNDRFGLWNTSTNTIVYSFSAETVWSTNNQRIITSYPSSRSICNA